MNDIAQAIIILAIIWVVVLCVCSLILTGFKIKDYFEDKKSKGGKK